MRILLWHGYLLTGSGSNVYTANVARVWRDAGHDVLLMCQERRTELLDWVDSDGDFNPDNRSISFTDPRESGSRGRCRVVRPSIGRILPLYVYDVYEGFEAKLFVDLDDRELAHYVETNVEAMVTAIERFDPEVIITGHEVMGPYIAKVACEATLRPYAAKLHGSALEYAVKLQERYRRFAIEGLGGATSVIGGSRYMIYEAAAHIPGWEERAVVINPGCNVELFHTVEREEPDVPVVAYVGKLIVSKGVHNLLAALPLIEGHPFSAVVVGYGGWAAELEALWEAIASRDIQAIKAIEASAGAGALLSICQMLQNRVPEVYWERAARLTVEFPGRYEHDQLAAEMPFFDVVVVPSVLPEAFGMIAAEAAACGVLPVVPGHSGIGEAAAAIEAAIGRPGLLTYDPGHPVAGIAGALERILALPFAERRALGAGAAELARARWSWQTVAHNLLQAASR